MNRTSPIMRIASCIFATVRSFLMSRRSVSVKALHACKRQAVQPEPERISPAHVFRLKADESADGPFIATGAAEARHADGNAHCPSTSIERTYFRIPASRAGSTGRCALSRCELRLAQVAFASRNSGADNVRFLARRAKARSFSGCKSRPATFVPAGSNRSGRRGNEATGASGVEDRKSTRLNSSHLGISYAVFCLKKKNTVTPARAVDVVNAACRRHQLGLSWIRGSLFFF